MEIYVWTDVAIVYLLCAVPCAIVLVGRRLSRAAALVLSATCLAAALGMLNMQVEPHPVGLPLLRAAVALALAMSAALMWSAITGPRQSSSGRGGIIVLSFAVLVVVPCVYVGARSRHDLARLGEMLGQHRFGEAQPLASSISLLAPAEELNGIPLSRVTAELGEIVRRLESAVASPEHRDGTGNGRLQRAVNLAMLGRTDEAIETLTPLARPEAHNVRGMIFQFRHDWHASLQAYQMARQGWDLRAESAERVHGLVQAVKGIALARRYLGQAPEAEAAYQEVLKLAPTADTHFLLAQFYEDAQDAAKSRAHARQAMSLDSKRYQTPGEELIRKLSVFQFGCWGVFSAESRR